MSSMLQDADATRGQPTILYLVTQKAHLCIRNFMRYGTVPLANISCKSARLVELAYTKLLRMPVNSCLVGSDTPHCIDVR